MSGLFYFYCCILKSYRPPIFKLTYNVLKTNIFSLNKSRSLFFVEIFIGYQKLMLIFSVT